MKANTLRRSILIILCLTVAGFVVAVLTLSGSLGLDPSYAKEYVEQNHISDTSAENAVTSVYLNYRYWDTLFESLILFVSVLAVISFSWSSNKPK